MAGTTAQWKWHIAAVGSDFGKKMLSKVGLTYDEALEKYGVSTRGKYKGTIKAFIVWCKITKGGWIKTGKNFREQTMHDEQGEIVAYNGYPVGAGSYCWHIVDAWPDVHGEHYTPKKWHSDLGTFNPDTKTRRADLDVCPEAAVSNDALEAEAAERKAAASQRAKDKREAFKAEAKALGVTQKRLKEIDRDAAAIDNAMHYLDHSYWDRWYLGIRVNDAGYGHSPATVADREAKCWHELIILTGFAA